MRLHPVTVVARLASRGLGLGWVVFVGGLFLARRGVVPAPVAYALVATVVAGVVAYEVAYYRRFDYDVTGDALEIRSGVFARREREIPLRRVQNVDVTRSLLARLAGVAVVAVETAGGGETEATLRFVGRAEARRLREVLRTGEATAAPETEGDAGSEEAGARSHGSDAGETLFVLSDRDLALFAVLGFDPRLVSGLVAVATLLVPTAGIVARLRGLDAVGLVALVLAVVALVWVASAVSRAVRFYDFRLHRVGDELRYERGLLSRHDGTVPLSKLQTLTVGENPPMRYLGLASLGVETAGYAPGAGPRGGSEAAVPIADRETVLALARSLEPFHDVALAPPPERARRRYVRRYALVGLGVVGLAGLLRLGFGPGALPVPWYALALCLPLAVPAGRLAHAHRGYDVGPDHVVTRAGFWRRRTRVVPHYRVQTVVVRRTVFQRRWDLASVVVD
ncbi:MAG: PH domain-containing protein, partial [Halobacteriaceae archaeon]